MHSLTRILVIAILDNFKKMEKKILNRPTSNVFLKDIRLKKRITLKQLSEATNLSTSYLSAIENGVNSPNLERLKQICKGLDVPFEAVLILASDSENPLIKEKLKPIVQEILYDLFMK
ncbi:MAG: helix-turn-helix protein [Bacteroidota bacterium]|jgi:transcriptional regulator with XRE-family HTH domain